MFKIVHLSITPVAGSPARICSALNTLPEVDARHIQCSSEVLDRFNFPRDLIWERDKKESIECIKEANVIHLHNYLDLDSKHFDPIDFKLLWEKGKIFVQHFHSNPELITRMMGKSFLEICKSPLPKFTCAQYMERFYPGSVVVPNIVDIFKAPKAVGEVIRVGYSPSNFRYARDFRWDTKGYPETKKILNKFVKKAKRAGIPVELDIMENVSFDECQRRKSNCHIFVDDLVTGSYHLSSLEAMAQGCVTLSYLDERVVKTTTQLLHRTDFPVINTRLEEAISILLNLVSDRDRLESMRKETYTWMCKHWSQECWANFYLGLYKSLFENPMGEAPEMKEDMNRLEYYQTIEHSDIIWANRKNLWPPAPSPIYLKVKSTIGKYVRLLLT